MEGLWRLEGVNISKGRVRAEGMEQSHVAAENIGEQRRMLGMKFYITPLLYCIYLCPGEYGLLLLYDVVLMWLFLF